MVYEEKNTTSGRLADIIKGSTVIINDGEMDYKVSNEDRDLIVSALQLFHLLANEYAKQQK